MPLNASATAKCLSQMWEKRGRTRPCWGRDRRAGRLAGRNPPICRVEWRITLSHPPYLVA